MGWRGRRGRERRNGGRVPKWQEEGRKGQDAEVAGWHGPRPDERLGGPDCRIRGQGAEGAASREDQGAEVARLPEWQGQTAGCRNGRRWLKSQKKGRKGQRGGQEGRSAGMADRGQKAKIVE